MIDLITNIDMQGFQTHNGLNSFIKRLDMEVNVCRKEQPYQIEPEQSSTEATQPSSDGASSSRYDWNAARCESFEVNTMECSEDDAAKPQKEEKTPEQPTAEFVMPKTGKTCLPQRAALLKSMLNFLKKAIQDPAFSDSIRHVMEGTLPNSLKHIISNSEYYGPSLFLLAADVVTVYVYQEPSLLSTLQDNGLTDVVLHALLTKEVT